MSSEFSAMP